MTYSFLNQLSESKMFPTTASVDRRSMTDISELTLLYICGLRILLASDESEKWSSSYARKTSNMGNFDHWRGDSTDLYVLLHTMKGIELTGGYSLSFESVMMWLRDAAHGANRETMTRRLLMRLDVDLKIKNEVLKAIRRLTQTFTEIDRTKRELVVSRLIEVLAKRAPKSDMLAQLQALARRRGYELGDEDDLLEDASAGATAAGNVATVATPLGGLGPGFDPNGDKGIYAGKKPVVLRRPPMSPVLTPKAK